MSSTGKGREHCSDHTQDGGRLTGKIVVYILIVTYPVTKRYIMTRSIPRGMAAVLEALELEQPRLVTNEALQSILERESIKTPSRIVALRLREKGWLNTTEQQGVWEFIPAAVAGPIPSSDPLIPLKAFILKNPETACALTFQSAAWAHDYADRIPLRLEVAVEEQNARLRLPRSIRSSTFRPILPPVFLRDVPVLSIESILVHMTTRPSAVRSWQSALEWLPSLAGNLDEHLLSEELKQRPYSVSIRTGYLLQGMRPDLAASLFSALSPKAIVRFGPQQASIRTDRQWLIADTLLPFDPREIAQVG